MDLSLVIRNGRIIDGTGNAWYRADIGVAGSSIRSIGCLTSHKAPIELDAAGKVVAPGFIDIHTHSDVSCMVDPKVDSKLQQGITTDIVGQCGWSVAPLANEKDRQSIVQGVFLASHPVIPQAWDWRSFSDYGKRIDEAGTSMNPVPYTHLTLPTN